MGEEIAFENGRISNYEWHVTLTLTLDWVILHTYITRRPLLHTKFHWNRRNFLWTDGRTDGLTYGRTDGHLRPTLLGRLRVRGVDLTRRHSVEYIPPACRVESKQGHSLQAINRCIGLNFPALRPDWFSRLRFHFLQQSTSGLSINNT